MAQLVAWEDAVASRRAGIEALAAEVAARNPPAAARDRFRGLVALWRSRLSQAEALYARCRTEALEVCSSDLRERIAALDDVLRTAGSVEAPGADLALRARDAAALAYSRLAGEADRRGRVVRGLREVAEELRELEAFLEGSGEAAGAWIGELPRALSEVIGRGGWGA